MSWDSPSFCLLWGILSRAARGCVHLWSGYCSLSHPGKLAQHHPGPRPGNGVLSASVWLGWWACCRPAGDVRCRPLSSVIRVNVRKKSNILHDLKVQLKYKTKRKSYKALKLKVVLRCLLNLGLTVLSSPWAWGALPLWGAGQGTPFTEGVQPSWGCH